MLYSKSNNGGDVIASFFDIVPNELTPVSLNTPELDGVNEQHDEYKEFRIRLANTHERLESASILINKMYSWRGYETGEIATHQPNRITLLVSGSENATIATMSIGLDSDSGLFADAMYSEVLNTLRHEGRKLCEYNKFAVDPKIKSMRVLASLFHIAYLYPYGVFGKTDGVVEVNPRHVRFYEKMLGFTQIGREKICQRVNAPSVLLRTNFSYVTEQIEKFGGLMEKAGGEKSLYPYFFTKEDEIGILGRLKTTG